MTRDTTDGRDFEQVVSIALHRSGQRHGFVARSQQIVGGKPGGGQHRVDWELIALADANRRGLVSCKFQNKQGTAEEKIVYEVIKLLYAMEQDARYAHGWLAIGGIGWSPGLLDFVSRDLPVWIPRMKGAVTILAGADTVLSFDFTL